MQSQGLVAPKGTIFVEVQSNKGMKDPTADVERSVRKALRLYQELRVGECIDLRDFDTAHIERVEVTGCSLSKTCPDCTPYRIDEMSIDISVFSLFGTDDQADMDATSDLFRILRLPHETFDGLWENLVYEKPVKELCLRALSSAIDERRENGSARHIDPWQNTVLLYGPPGSGKSSMAQAIAQRLSVRFLNKYNGTRLLQIHAPALLSHLWGETVKRIGDLFQSVATQARQEEPPLVIVLLDEVETFATCREKSMLRSEPSDGVKATAELLRGLDDCRRYENIVFLFTSNFISTLDTAFLDRIRIKKKIDLPNADCIFEILRKEVNNLIDQGLIVVDTWVCNSNDHQNNCIAETNGIPSRVPTLDWARSNWPETVRTAVSELQRIAALTQGLSPRSAKGLLDLARHEYLVEKPSKLQDALAALELVLREEIDQGLRVEGHDVVTTMCTESREEQNIAELVSDLLRACQPRYSDAATSEPMPETP